MQEFTIFGIRVKDYSQKESLRLLGEYLHNGGLNIVSYLNTQILVEAENDEQCRDWLNALDMTIIAESDIMKAVENFDANRIKEIENGFLMKSLMHKIAKNKMSIYLIADSEPAMIELEDELKLMQPSLKVGGRFVYAQGGGTESLEDAMTNDINDVAPTMIISRIAFKEQLRLMAENKRRINAELWLALIQGGTRGIKKPAKMKVNAFFYRTLFHRKMNKYKNENAEQ